MSTPQKITQCEPLEPRALHSATAAVPTFTVDRGKLAIFGTSGVDRVVIRTTDAGTFVRLTDDASVRKRFSPGAIRSISFDGGGAKDRLNVDTQSNAITFSRRVEKRVVNLDDGTATSNFATTAAPGIDVRGLRYWLKRFKQQKAATVGTNPKTVLIGDSITERLATVGNAEWTPMKKGFQAADLGFSGDTTSSLLYRLKTGLLDGIWPKTIFVSVGTNNIALTDNVKNTVRGIRAVLATIHRLRPRAKIVLSSILPRGFADEHAATVTAVNDKLDTLAAEYDAVFADARAAMSPAITDPLDFDGATVHLSQAGYSKWTPVIAQGIAAAMKARAA